MDHGPNVLVVLLAAAALCWSAAHTRRGRPSPRPRTRAIAVTPEPWAEQTPQLAGTDRPQLPAGVSS